MRAGLLAFHEIRESIRDTVREATLAAARTLPGFAALLESTPPELARAQEQHARKLERAAIVDSDWDPYLANLREQGRLYANLGLGLHEWFGLLTSFRRCVLEEMVARLASEPDALCAAVIGMDALLDLAMSTVGTPTWHTRRT